MDHDLGPSFHDNEQRDSAANLSLMIRQQLNMAREITPSHNPTTKAVIDELFEQFYAAAVERNDAITMEAWGFQTEEGKGVRETHERMMRAVGNLIDAVLIRWEPDKKKHYAPHSYLFTHMMRIMQLLEQQATAEFDDNYSPAHGEYSEITLHHVINNMIKKAIRHDKDPRIEIMKRIENDFNLDDIEAGILETRLAAEERMSKKR